MTLISYASERLKAYECLQQESLKQIRALEAENTRLRAALGEIVKLVERAAPWPVECDDILNVTDKAARPVRPLEDKDDE
jgi:hypothetical protein